MNIPKEMKYRLHPNGFVQLDLAPGIRLHIWHDLFPRQKTRTPIHDHVFSFESVILLGQMTNVEYDIFHLPGEGTHEVYEASYRGQESVLNPVLTKDQKVLCVSPTITKETTRERGQRYWMQMGKFHESKPLGACVTLMKKREVCKDENAKPRVLVPYGLAPDNEFSRSEHVHEYTLALIEQTLGLL